YRRRLLERSYGHSALPVEHPRRTRPQLGERDRHGNTDRAQGRRRRSEGASDDDARYSAASRTREERVGLLQQRSDEGYDIQELLGSRQQARRLVEQGDRGEVSAENAEAVLRCVHVRYISRTARHQVPDGEIVEMSIMTQRRGDAEQDAEKILKLFLCVF